MKKLRPYQYLIEGLGQLNAAIQDFCDQCHMDFNENNINYGDVPETWPYVAIMTGPEDSAHINIEYVLSTDFYNTDDEVKHLYEFRIRRAGLTSPYRVHESDYQIPAGSVIDAVMQLGQAYHRDEEYDLTILSWKQVR